MSENNNDNLYIIISEPKTVWRKFFRKNNEIFRVDSYSGVSIAKWNNIKKVIEKFEVNNKFCKNNTYRAAVVIACRNKYFCGQFVSYILNKFITYYFSKDTHLIKSYKFFQIANTTNSHTETIERYWVA